MEWISIGITLVITNDVWIKNCEMIYWRNLVSILFKSNWVGLSLFIIRLHNALKTHLAILKINFNQQTAY